MSFLILVVLIALTAATTVHLLNIKEAEANNEQ
jgi:hypothetical protein